MCHQFSWQQRSIWGRRAGEANQQPRGEGSTEDTVISCPRGNGEKFYRTSTRLGSREEFRSEFRGSKQPTSYHSSPFISWQRWSIDMLSAGTKTELAGKDTADAAVPAHLLSACHITAHSGTAHSQHLPLLARGFLYHTSLSSPEGCRIHTRMNLPWVAGRSRDINIPDPPTHTPPPSRTTLGNVLYTVSQSFQQDLAA